MGVWHLVLFNPNFNKACFFFLVKEILKNLLLQLDFNYTSVSPLQSPPESFDLLCWQTTASVSPQKFCSWQNSGHVLEYDRVKFADKRQHMTVQIL